MSDQLIVRTMKDDIAEMNAVGAAAPLPDSTAVPVPPTPSAPVVSKSKHKKPEPPVFSLPSKKSPIMNEEAGSVPSAESKGRKHILLGVAYLALFCAIVSGAVYGYIRYSAKQTAIVGVPNDPILSEVIPKEALAVIDYNVETQDSRNVVAQIWSEAGRGTDVSAATGNPTSLLTIPNVTRVYYVILPDNSKPFLLMSTTDDVREYVSQHRDVQSIEIGKWHVIHEDNIEGYSAALTNGSIAENSQLLSANDTASYVIRYALSPSMASRQFNSVTSTAIGLSQVDGLVFYVVGTAGDGTIRASAQIPGDPPGEGVVEDTTELISLIPRDISFARVGFNFAEDVAFIKAESPQIDASVLAQPAVRQFISQFSTPYAIYERKGTDGVPDIGLIMQLPASMKQQMRIGEPVIEQGLPALIPLIIGKVLGIQTVFNEGIYNGVPLRYVNLNGQTQTLDYMVGDNFLLIASSREGANALIDTSLEGKQGISPEEPWKSLEEKASEITKDRAFVIGSLTDPSLLNVLPVASGLSQVPIIASHGRTSTGIDIQAVLLSK